MPRWLVSLMILVIIVGIPPLLVMTNILLIPLPAWLQFEYSRPEVPKSVRFNDKDRLYFATESMEFERGNRTFEQFVELGVYNNRELKHMVDVRVLLAQMWAFDIMDAILLVVALLVLWNSSNARALLPRAVLRGALLTIVLFAVIGIFAATAFDFFFTNFHYVFFEGVSGFFLATDSLIQFYPQQFWFDTAIMLAGLTVLEAAIVAVIAWLVARRVQSGTKQPVGW